MAQSGVRYRRAVRTFRSSSPLMQGLAVATALVLMAGVAGAGVLGAGGSSPSGGPAASGSAGRGAGSPGPGAGQPSAASTTTSLGATTSTTAGRGPGASAGGPVSSATTTTVRRSDNPGRKVAISAAVARSLCGTKPASSALQPSDQGVTANSIRVAFPYFDPTAAFALTGTTQAQPANQQAFIQAYVDCINAAGGILGRQIIPEIQVFNPLDENLMHALCLKWATEDKVFAVVDSAGWYGQSQLCVTQDYHLPLVTEESYATEYGQPGRPYLWWTGPSADQVLANLVLWARDTGRLKSSMRIGVVTSDRPEDQDALNNHLLPDLSKAGLHPTDVETFTYDRSQAEAQATLAATKMAAKHIDVLLPLLTFDSFAFWLQAAQNQDFYPRYLLSDYEAEMVEAQALLGDRYPRSLEHATGPTFIRLAEVDKYPDTYSPTERRCEQIWKAEHPESNITKADENMRWCDNIALFVEAAVRAGPALTRLKWADAMGTIQHFPAAMTPEYNFSPTNFAGPDQAKVVQVLTSNCPAVYAPPSGNTCVVPVTDYAPFRTFS